MTREELRELYHTCVYCELDNDVEKELSDYELSEIFIPIIDEMISEGYDTSQIGDFVECCYYCYFMSDITLHALIERYDLEIEITVQKGARVRTITAEKMLSALRNLGVPRRYLDGLRVRIDRNAQDYAKAYNGIPYSTQFEAEYRNGWKITAIERCEAKRNGRKHKYDILAISNEAREKIVENTIKRDVNW